MAQPRLRAASLAAFGSVALVLTLVGLYGALSYAVARRSHEIGVRLVLGARPGDVLRMIVRQGASLVGAGLALGGVIALAAGGLLSSLLFEVRPRDPVVLAVVFVTLGAGGLVAILVPSLRATRVDPVRALRNE